MNPPLEEDTLLFTAQSTHRVATGAFWRTFHHDGKICPAWWGTITYKVAGKAPAESTDTLPLFHLYPFVLCGLQYKGNVHQKRDWRGC